MGKFTIVIAYVLMIIVLLSGCLYNNDKISSVNEHPLIRHHMKFLVDEKSIGKEYFENIILALENKDNEKMKALFSKSIQQNCKTLDDDIEYLFGLVDSKITYDTIDTGPYTESESYYGKKRSTSSYCLENICIEGEKYLFFMKICTIDDNDEKNIGLKMLQIIKQEQKEELFDWGGEKTACDGIYRPPV